MTARPGRSPAARRRTRTPDATSSRVNRPAKTDRRRKRIRSSGPSRSWLHSMAVRSVWWRGRAARLPPVSRPNRSARRSSICSTERTRVLTAASSIASGRPSSRRQTSTTAIRLEVVSSNRPEAAAALSVKSSTDSLRRSWSRVSSPCARGSSSGGIGMTCSPVTDSGSRLVATTRTPGADLRTSVTSSAAASSRCSQLSTRRSSFRSRRWESRRARGWVAAWSRRSRAARTALSTRPGSRTSASSTSHAPSGKARARSVPIRIARRVLPTPPGPTRVTRRTVASFFRSSASSRRRPTKLVASAGRLPRRRVGLAMVTSTVLRAVGGPWPARSRPNHETHRCRRAPPRRRLACMTDADTGSA